MRNDLNSLLARRNITLDELHDNIYKAMLLSIFSKIYNYLESGQRAEFKVRLQKCRNKSIELIKVQKLVDDICQIQITDKEAEYLLILILAYYRKSNGRKKIQNKDEIFTKYRGRCKICGKSLQMNECHYDHIIPFKYVGDELDENFQLLCRDCNFQKSSNIYFDMMSKIRV